MVFQSGQFVFKIYTFYKLLGDDVTLEEVIKLLQDKYLKILNRFVAHDYDFIFMHLLVKKLTALALLPKEFSGDHTVHQDHYWKTAQH